MEAQAKLARTQSSLLRSSPTFRSSTAEIDCDNGEKEQRPQRSGGVNFSPARGRAAPPSLLWFPLFAFVTAAVFLSFLYLMTEMEISTSENLLIALILFAVALFFAGKNKQLIGRSIFTIKQVYNDSSKFLGFSRNRARSSVQWYIGCEKKSNPNDSDHRSSLFSSAEVREGVEFYSNGDIYEGEFHKGKVNGRGVYTYFVNGRYEGDWVDGKYDGYGIESWARGSRYRGQYRQGLRHGVGVYRFFTGDNYAGEWFNGQYHGVGVQTCADGSCYVGEFKCGAKHGLGCYHFRNGDRYGGEYFGDKIHGFGVYHFANGHCYEGSWHEGRKQGYGVYTFRKGETRSGEWNTGSLKTPFPPDSDSVLRATQFARKAAESAVELRQVDDLVKRSVTAANRASAAARVAAIRAVQNRVEGRCCNTGV